VRAIVKGRNDAVTRRSCVYLMQMCPAAEPVRLSIDKQISLFEPSRARVRGAGLDLLARGRSPLGVFQSISKYFRWRMAFGVALLPLSLRYLNRHLCNDDSVTPFAAVCG